MTVRTMVECDAYAFTFTPSACETQLAGLWSEAASMGWVRVRHVGRLRHLCPSCYRDYMDSVEKEPQ